jgi:hypothetical protein
VRATWLIRLLVALACAAIAGWVVHETRWVEIDVDEGERGAAATDPVYTLRRLLEANGATLEMRTTLEPLPPPNATLLLNSTFWNIFPGRSERLKAWVQNGGHLVVQGMHEGADKDLRWLPVSFFVPKPRRPASAPASAPGDVVGATLPPAQDSSQRPPVVPAARHEPDQPFDHPFKGSRRGQWGDCQDFREPDGTPSPAYDAGRVYRGCANVQPLRAVAPATPTWSLVNRQQGVLAMRVPYGKGSVTGVSFLAVLHNRSLLQADNGLITSAILQAGPGRAVWIVEDESREALPLWMWHEARTPTLLILAAVLLSLWRLLPRFGPREAAPPQARRSMGEQVSGTGQFIAAADPRALHDATRRAFEAVGRTRVEGWADRDGRERVAALADALAPTVTLDRGALLSALTPPPAATPAQILAAIAVIEQARRALLRTPVSPFAN